MTDPMIHAAAVPKAHRTSIGGLGAIPVFTRAEPMGGWTAGDYQTVTHGAETVYRHPVPSAQGAAHDCLVSASPYVRGVYTGCTQGAPSFLRRRTA